jgi:hypothetical protein
MYLAVLGIVFSIMLGSWGFVWEYLRESEIFIREDYGLGSFFQDGYFILFDAALLIGFGYMIMTRLRSH